MQQQTVRKLAANKTRLIYYYVTAIKVIFLYFFNGGGVKNIFPG
jgi:hypothetical protein